MRSLSVYNKTTGLMLFSVTRETAVTTLNLNELITVGELKNWMHSNLYDGLRPKNRGCQQLIAVIEQALVHSKSVFEQHCFIHDTQPWFEAVEVLVKEARKRRTR